MAICKFCEHNEATKKNTHYLTDGIIRSCLNIGGTNSREKGMMFDISNKKTSIEARFQRETPVENVEETFGRAPNEIEIAQAKENPFAVDYIFCPSCEHIFTDIETKFQERILPNLRGQDLTGQIEVEIEDNILFRQFFLLQAVRSSICDPEYELEKSLEQKIKRLLLEKEIEKEEILSIPMAVTYLNTLGDDYEYTRNTVGFASIDQSKMILMNDFIVQVFPRIESSNYIDFFGVNDPATFYHFTNYKEEKFRLKIISNDDRIAISQNYALYRARIQLAVYVEQFQIAFFRLRKYYPGHQRLSEFISDIIYGISQMDNPQYSQARIDNLLKFYINLR